MKNIIKCEHDHITFDNINEPTEKWYCKDCGLSVSKIKAQAQVKRSQLYYQRRLTDIGLNIVTCGNCSTVIIHETDEDKIMCHVCAYEDEQCQFPDLNY